MPRKKLTRDELQSLRQRIASDMKNAIEWAPRCCVRISGGNGSAAMLFRCIEWFGKDRVSAVFADTRSEHPDLYRFIDDLERISGIEITRLDQGKNIWDVFDETGIMKTPRHKACKASIMLKREPLDKFSESIGYHFIAIGFDFTEPERIAGLIDTKPRLIFPLAVHPILSECDFREMLQSRGISLSTLYGENFAHNNCGGGCVLAGLGQWSLHYKMHPERFAQDEAREKVFNERTGFSVLRDQRGCETKSFTLSQLRESVDSGVKYRSEKPLTCSCMFD